MRRLLRSNNLSTEQDRSRWFEQCFVRWMSALCPSLESKIAAIATNLSRLNPLKKTLPKKRLRVCLDCAYLAQLLGEPAKRLRQAFTWRSLHH